MSKKCKRMKQEGGKANEKNRVRYYWSRCDG